MSANKISTIIFDAGGVLLYINRRRNDIVRKLLLSMGYDIENIDKGIKVAEIFDEVYFSNHQWIYNWNEERDWLIGHYNAIAKTIDASNEYLGEKLFMLTFDTYEYVLYPEVIEVLENLKNNYKLGILSNALPSLDWAFDNLGIRKYFGSIIISAYEGIEKPNKNIYITAVERLESKFEECIFIDDKIENVEMSKNLGIKGFHLNRETDTLKILLKLLECEFNVA